MSAIRLPLTFNALSIARAGAPVSLQQKTVDKLGDDEVLIRVSHASINKMDPGRAIRGAPNTPEPYVLGFDFSGEVAMLGGQSGGGRLSVGQQVFGRSLTGGSFAEYVVTQKEHVLPRGRVPAAEASTLGIAYMTAYESVVTAGDIARHTGAWIYVAGAAGGVGHFAAQLAKIYGLKVVGSAGKAASLELLRRLEVDRIIDYSKQNVVEEIMKLTAGNGVDVVYDSTYTQASYIQSTAVVASGGDYIRLGTLEQLARVGGEDMSGAVASRGARMIIGDAGRYGFDPHYMAQAAKLTEGLERAVAWCEEGKLRPIITATVPFDATALQEAFESFMKGKINVGKVVVQVTK